MENVRSQESEAIPDWRTRDPLAGVEMDKILDEAKKDLLDEDSIIAPEIALERAFSAFNALTSYEDDPKRGLIYDPRIYSATNILKYQKGAEIFGIFSDAMSDDSRVSFGPSSNTAHEDKDGNGTYSMTVANYAATLKQRTRSLVDEDCHMFAGINTDHNPERGYHAPDHRNSQILSGILYEEQSKSRGLYSAFRPEMSEEFPPLDIVQITLLCRLQADLKEAIEHNRQYSDKETLKIKLDKIHDLLEQSPELTPQRLEDLPIATAMMNMIHASVIQELAELSLDGNPEDFAGLRDNCAVLPIGELQNIEGRLTRKSTFEISTALAVKRFREIEKSIDDVMQRTGVDLSSIRNDNRHRHDGSSVKIGLQKIDFSGNHLSDLPEIDIQEFIKTITQEMGKTAVMNARVTEHDHSPANTKIA